MLKCTICDLVIDEVPNDAVQIGATTKGDVTFVRFADGTVHCLSSKLGKGRKAGERRPTPPEPKAGAC